MGRSAPESVWPGELGGMVAPCSVALLVLALAGTLALPLVSGARVGEDPPPSGGPPGGGPGQDNDCRTKKDCYHFFPSNECCDYEPPIDCLEEVCEHYLQYPQQPQYCSRPPDPYALFSLIAQIALGAALVVAIAALINVILRSCKKEPRRRRRRPQMRTTAGSVTSAELYFNERLQDCPPCYDDVSWEKPPSYCNLQIIEESPTDGTVSQDPPASPIGASQPGVPQGTRVPATPPPYGGVYTISQHMQHLQTPPPNSGEDRGIVFAAPVHNQVLDQESSNEPSKSVETKVETTGTVSH